MINRFLFLFGFVLCASLVAAALYSQYVSGLEPCPLCIFQRVAFIGVGVILLVGFLHAPHHWGARIYGYLAAMVALLGAAVAGRHVWLQNLPADQVPECGPGLEYMFEAFPLTKVFELVLRGSGECAEIQWTLFGLSMPMWSLVWLVVLACLCFYIGRRPRRR